MQLQPACTTLLVSWATKQTLNKCIYIVHVLTSKVTENCLLSTLHRAKGSLPCCPLVAGGMRCHHLGGQTFQPTWPEHHQPLHSPCPRAHSHRIYANRPLLSVLSLPCCTGGSSQRASGTQLGERQTPAGSTCCAKELRKCCCSGEESAATRCEGWSPDVRGMSASHNWESCLPP